MEKQTIECTVSVKTSMDNVSSLVFMVDTTKDEITKTMLRTAIKRVLERDLGVNFDSDKVEYGTSRDFHKVQKLNQAAASAEPHVTDLTDWIDWHGGKMPVDGKAIVEVRFRKKGRRIAHADVFSWGHHCFDGDIIAYRLAK